jgi:xanthosine utilization system XapX-like protein
MQPPDPTTNALLLALSLIAKGFAAGAFTGAFVGAVQIRLGKWHPLWADSFFRWLSYPCYAGLTIGVMVALFNVPAGSPAKPAWLLLCVAVAGASALVGSSVVARFLKLRKPGLAGRGVRRSGSSPDAETTGTPTWEDTLRAKLFGSAPPRDESQPRKDVSLDLAPLQQRPTVIPRRPSTREAGRKNAAVAASSGTVGAKVGDASDTQRRGKRGRHGKKRGKEITAGSPREREPANQGRFEKPIK